MEQEKRPPLEEENINKESNPELDQKSDLVGNQIDSELDKRAELILDNPKIAPLVEKLGQHASLKKHLEKGQWLNEKQLKVLDLDSETSKAYSELREFFEKQERMTEDDRLLEHLKEKNKQIQSKNESEKEAIFKERCYLEAEEIRESLKYLKSRKDFHSERIDQWVYDITSNIIDEVRFQKLWRDSSYGTFMNADIHGPFFPMNAINKFIKALFVTDRSYMLLFGELTELNRILKLAAQELKQKDEDEQKKLEKGNEASASRNRIMKFIKGIFE